MQTKDVVLPKSLEVEAGGEKENWGKGGGGIFVYFLRALQMSLCKVLGTNNADKT